MGKFKVVDGNKVVTFETGSHSEDVELMRKLLGEGKKFTYEKFGKTMAYGG